MFGWSRSSACSISWTTLFRTTWVEKFECVATSYGNKPIMCDPNGGYRTTADADKLTGFDLNGRKALLANARAQGVG